MFFRALMDCLVLPIQNKLEEWKKITHHLDKEHAKGTKRKRVLKRVHLSNCNNKPI